MNALASLTASIPVASSINWAPAELTDYRVTGTFDDGRSVAVAVLGDTLVNALASPELGEARDRWLLGQVSSFNENDTLVLTVPHSVPITAPLAAMALRAWVFQKQ